MTRRLRHEDGWAIVTAVLVMTIMVVVGLAMMALVDTQQRESGRERTRESAFNLAEGALSAQTFVVSRRWPGSASNAFPASCASSATVGLCPNPTKVSASFSSSDYARGASWSTRVRDNGGGYETFYTEAGTTGQPAWDANGDGQLWIRSTATVTGKTRTILALVQVQRVALSFPRNSITAGWFQTTNNGNKVIIDTKGPASQAAPLAVRCNSPNSSSCLGYNKSKGQVSPDVSQVSYPSATAVSSQSLDLLRSTAQANGTYYTTSCPTTMSGAVVFVENANCSYNGNKGNTIDKPGIFVIATGTLTLSGNATFYGLIYLANLQNSSGAVLSLQGTSLVQGSVAIDGPGGISAGSSGLNMKFDPNALAAATTYGDAGIVQNTWREIQG